MSPPDSALSGMCFLQAVSAAGTRRPPVGGGCVRRRRRAGSETSRDCKGGHSRYRRPRRSVALHHIRVDLPRAAVPSPGCDSGRRDHAPPGPAGSPSRLGPALPRRRHSSRGATCWPRCLPARRRTSSPSPTSTTCRCRREPHAGRGRTGSPAACGPGSRSAASPAPWRHQVEAASSPATAGTSSSPPGRRRASRWPTSCRR